VAETDTQLLLCQELRGHVLECVKDQNGNHVIQKAIEKVDQNVIEFIVDSFEGEIAGLAVHPYGTASPNLSTHFAILHLLHLTVVACIRLTSTLPMQRLSSDTAPLGALSPETRQSAAARASRSTTTTSHRSSLQHGHPHHHKRDSSAHKHTLSNFQTGENTDELCRNQYGNYVVQHVLVHGSMWQREEILHALNGKVLSLSKHKFASNVVEKCFAHGYPYTLNTFDHTLLLKFLTSTKSLFYH
jgi:hypothetical protein